MDNSHLPSTEESMTRMLSYRAQGDTNKNGHKSGDSSIHHGTVARTVKHRSLMSTTRTRRRVASLVGAILMLLPVSLAMAQVSVFRRKGP